MPFEKGLEQYYIDVRKDCLLIRIILYRVKNFFIWE